jgi:hypothetical protein
VQTALHIVEKIKNQEAAKYDSDDPAEQLGKSKDILHKSSSTCGGEIMALNSLHKCGFPKLL